LAKELGVRLVRIVSFTENNGSYPRPVMYGLGASDSVATKAAAVPEISAGQQKVTDTVSITTRSNSCAQKTPVVFWGSSPRRGF